MRSEDARVVYEHVQTPESVSGRVDHPLDGCRISEIRADDDVPVARQRARDLLGHRRTTPEVDTDPITGRRERACNRGADPARGPGDKDRSTHPLAIVCQPECRSRD